MAPDAVPSMPPAQDLSRPRLREITRWIRDDLDLLVAREGPDSLRADDVLTLHEIFQALRTSSTITALDLRATGIHRAVIDVAGIATRWPGRLADDCDKIIEVWTAKFGRLEDLHPFLYGRGGRLEGIATAEEFSKAALIKRWQHTCPDKISPKRSHRHGNQGYKAGSWWINPLFACHAGVIDLDSVEGGITYDRHGAYAILLKDTGELEAPSEAQFTYRCGRADKGKFRLTAATPKSRASIRVLRSHSINSIWGPKAGVRYEGLYRVTGWIIRQMKSSDIAGHEYRAGDIMYDIRFERDDPTPMEEIINRPTATEVDDYAEYKRLRKVHREMHKKGLPPKSDAYPASSKVAPPIPPQPPMSKPLAGPIRIPTMKGSNPTAAEPGTVPRTTLSHALVPGARTSQMFAEEPIAGPLKSSLEVPSRSNQRPVVHGPKSDSPHSESRAQPSRIESSNSNASSVHTANSRLSGIKDVAPWVEYDLHVPLPETCSPPSSPQEVNARISRESTKSRDHGKDSPRSMRSGSPGPRTRREQRSSIAKKHSLLHLPRSEVAEFEGDSRKSVFERSRNPIAKLFDGAEDDAKHEDYFNYEPRPRRVSVDPEDALPAEGRDRRATSSEGELRPLSPVPLRALSPLSPFLLGRRDAICVLPYGYVTAAGTPTIEATEPQASTVSTENPFRDASSPTSLPVSLRDFISKPKPATAVSTPASTRRPRRDDGNEKDNGASVAADRLRRLIEDVKQLDVKVRFRDPFKELEARPSVRRQSTASVAPDVVD